MTIAEQASAPTQQARYTTALMSDWGEKATSIQNLHGNEIHVVLPRVDDASQFCYYLTDQFHGKLVCIICNDERILGNGFILRYVFEIGSDEGDDVFVILVCQVSPQGGKIGSKESTTFPSIALRIPAAALYEREIHDMFGLVPNGNPDIRPLVLHDEWPADTFPLRKDFNQNTKVPRVLGKPYSFIRVEGDDICEIPVGPVHAGIIEPGHFRFSISGENIVNLESRLFYTHKGVEKLAENLRLDQVVLLSERISGDEAVANSTAYCQAIEKAANSSVPEKAIWTRTLCSEMERIYNHLGTLAGITTDVGFAFGAARLNILKERMMALNEKVSGSRLLFGVNRIGGVGIDPSAETIANIQESTSSISEDFNRVISLIRSKSSVVDRLRGTGVVPRTVASDLRLVGILARATGIDVDTRRDHPYAAYPMLKADLRHDSPQHLTKYRVEMEKRQGDVLSRFDVRVDEVIESVEIVQQAASKLLSMADSKIINSDMHSKLEPYSHALGYAESHRGQTIHWVMVGADRNSLYRYKVRTASFVNWPAIEQAVLNDIVPDFPVVNKSFDLSYSGNDL